MKASSTVFAILLTAACASAAHAQDYNYVPGWANTTNHQYKGKRGGGEWEAKRNLFATLSAQSPEAKCTLRTISEADGNVITNQFRSERRKSGEQSALRSAQRKVAVHHKSLKAQGKC